MLNVGWIGAMSAVVCSLFGGAAQAQSAHRFVNIATAVLPEQGDPVALVFADAASARIAGDSATLQVVYALTEARTIRGQPTSYVVFNDEVGCTARTRRVVSSEIHAPAGAAAVTVTANDAAHPIDGALDEAILKIACQGASAGTGLADMEAVLADAAGYGRTANETSASVKHSFVLTGAVNGGALGAFDLFMDTATMVRSGDTVTAFALKVFGKPVDATAQQGAYTIDTVVYACQAKTAARRYLVVYGADGVPLQSGPDDTGPRPVKSGSVDDKAFGLACAGLDPGYAMQPSASVAEAVASARSSFWSKLRY
jgi:hypothetical protein